MRNTLAANNFKLKSIICPNLYLGKVKIEMGCLGILVSCESRYFMTSLICADGKKRFRNKTKICKNSISFHQQVLFWGIFLFYSLIISTQLSSFYGSEEPVVDMRRSFKFFARFRILCEGHKILGFSPFYAFLSQTHGGSKHPKFCCKAGQ